WRFSPVVRLYFYRLRYNNSYFFISFMAEDLLSCCVFIFVITALFGCILLKLTEKVFSFTLTKMDS
ncbi:hypothetical protein L9F63_003495, partial [Diploptera punctata]